MRLLLQVHRLHVLLQIPFLLRGEGAVQFLTGKGPQSTVQSVEVFLQEVVGGEMLVALGAREDAVHH